MKLLIASRNIYKTREIRELFNLPCLEIISANDIPDLPEIVEDGWSFQANAVKKAVSLALLTKLWTLADDSGLEVDALGGMPGVFSARYSGEPVDYGSNNVKLLRELAGITTRAARFRCVVAVSSPAGKAQTVEGICAGQIVNEAKGERGFGYDSVFIPDGHAITFAEMEPEAKNAISHRGQALKKARELWGETFAQPLKDWPIRMRKQRGFSIESLN